MILSPSVEPSSASFAPVMQARDGLLARIEEASLNATAVREQVFYDGWLLRRAPSPARRMRSVNILGLSTRALDERLAYCLGWYARADLPLILRLTSIGPDFELDAALASRGYEGYDPTSVMTAAITPMTSPVESSGITFQQVPVQRFATEVGRLKGSSEAVVAEHTARLSGLMVDLVPLLACQSDGTPVAAALGVIEDDLLGIFDVVTLPAQRRRGYGTALMVRLLDEARRRDCRHAYLQVETGNTAARALYARYGFVDSYSYWYRSLPAAAQQ